MKAFLKTVSNSVGEFFSPLRWVVPFVKDVFFSNMHIGFFWILLLLSIWYAPFSLPAIIFFIIGVLTDEIRDNTGNGSTALRDLQQTVIELQHQVIEGLTAQLKKEQEETTADEHRNDS